VCISVIVILFLYLSLTYHLLICTGIVLLCVQWWSYVDTDDRLLCSPAWRQFAVSFCTTTLRWCIGEFPLLLSGFAYLFFVQSVKQSQDDCWISLLFISMTWLKVREACLLLQYSQMIKSSSFNCKTCICFITDL